MIEKTRLPKEQINGEFVMRRRMKEDEVELQTFDVDKHTSIKRYKEKEHWEVLLYFPKMVAYVCLKGEEHGVDNMSDTPIKVSTVKGKGDYSYKELSEFFTSAGFTVYSGSLIVND